LSIARDARAAVPASLRDRDPATISARDVVTAAQVGDADALRIWEHAVGWLGIGISSACNLINPGIVVLGGGLTGAGEFLFAPLRDIMAYRVLGKAVQLKSAALGDVVGIIGGAALCIDG
jgi:glucokinase